jgi:hypothetical protein
MMASRVPDGGDLDLERDLLGHEDAAALEGCVPGHADVLAVDDRCPFQADYRADAVGNVNFSPARPTGFDGDVGDGD